MNDEEIKQRIEEFRRFWWHAYKLPNGMIIERDDQHLDSSIESKRYPENVWEQVEEQVPDVKGMKILDIGSNAGWYSFKLFAMGADDVTGIDICQDDVSREAQCNFLKDILVPEDEKDKIRFKTGDFLDLDEKEAYDLIWFFGVYYHLPDHKRAFPKLNQLLKTGGYLFVESAIELETRVCPHDKDTHRSRTHFVPSREYLEQDLRDNGFEVLWVKEQNRGYAGHRIMIKARKK